MVLELGISGDWTAELPAGRAGADGAVLHRLDAINVDRYLIASHQHYSRLLIVGYALIFLALLFLCWLCSCADTMSQLTLWLGIGLCTLLADVGYHCLSRAVLPAALADHEVRSLRTLLGDCAPVLLNCDQLLIQQSGRLLPHQAHQLREQRTLSHASRWELGAR